MSVKVVPIDILKDVTVKCSFGEIVRGDKPIGYLGVSGEYKEGASGASDAHYMRGMLNCAMEKLFLHSQWIYDFSTLSYVWGDEMEWFLPPEGEDAGKIALVIGDKCKGAISTLYDMNAAPEDCLKEDGIFATLEKAVVYLEKRRGVAE